jgi:aspartate/methionine/tyrosine aminotransferase
VRYSSLVNRLHTDAAAGWAVHFDAWQAQERGEDVIILSIGDPDLATPEPIVDRAVEALRAGDTHYTEIAGRTPLRAAVAADVSARTGVPLGPEHVLICAGTQNALMAAGLCLLDRGDEVIGLDPMYLTYDATLGLGGAELVRVAQPAAAGFRPDPTAIEAAVTDRTRALMITSPNNPTGVVLRRDELVALAEIATVHDLWVIADEVYGDLVFEGEHTPMLSVPGMAERTVTVSSLSKSHAMTGWRMGWMVGPPELIDHADALQINVQYGLPGFVQEAGLAAVTEYRQAFAPMRDLYRRRCGVAAEILGQADELDVLVPQAGMYLLVDVRRVAESGAAFARGLFDAHRVSVVDAAAFGAPTEGWIRISFTIDDDRLAEGCQRIVDFACASGG